MAESHFLEDLTIVLPEPKVIRIGRKDDYQEVDIGVFPASAMLKMVVLFKSGHQPTVEEMAEVAADACSIANPKITKEYLMTKITLPQLSRFCEAVFVYGNKQITDFNDQMGVREGKKVEGQGEPTKN